MTWSFFGGIHNFFQSATWFVIQTLGALFLILFWAATVYWVRKDAKRRIKSPSMIQLVTVIGAVPPFLGPLVYMLFRPPEYLEDVRERELEIQAIERRLGAHGVPGLPRRGRRGLPRLPGLHDEASPGVRELPAPARARVAGLPVLRDPGRPATARAVAVTNVDVASTPKAPPRTAGEADVVAQGHVSFRGRMAVERTLILAKPDAVRRNLAGEIVARFERRGLELRAARLLVVATRARRDALRRAPREAVLRRARRLHHLGADARVRARGRGRDRDRAQDDRRDEPGRRRSGSLRGEFALAMPNNLVHGSDSPESAEREIGLWFPDGLV